MVDAEPNMRVLRRSRKKPQAGDVFVALFPDGQYVFGRVILAEPDRAPMPGSHLIYVYRARSASKEPDPAWLRRDELLVPPIFINKLPWTKGYFETVAHWPLQRGDLLEQHCFYDGLFEWYVDLTGARRAEKVEPCGSWGLASYEAFDDRVSDALGIPRAPEKDEPGPAEKIDRDALREAGHDAVVVHLPPGGDEDDLALDELEDALAAAAEDAGVGELDGNEVGPGGADIILYGPDGDRLLEAVRPVLTATRLPPRSYAAAYRRDPHAPESHIDLSD